MEELHLTLAAISNDTQFPRPGLDLIQLPHISYGDQAHALPKSRVLPWLITLHCFFGTYCHSAVYRFQSKEAFQTTLPLTCVMLLIRISLHRAADTKAPTNRQVLVINIYL